MIKTVALRTAFVLCAASMIALACAGVDAPKLIDIPAGPLSDALIQLSKQYSVDLFYRPEQVRGIKTHGVRGELTTQEAVTRLIEGTALKLSTDATGAMVIGLPGVESKATALEAGSAGLRVSEASNGVKEPASSSPDTASSEGSKGATVLEEVVVTAQKRAVAENIKDVPMTINAISGESLQKRGIGDVKDLTFAVPSLSFHSFGAGTGILNIRGIGGERGNAPTVGLYLDDIPAEAAFVLNTFNNTGLDVRTYDLERVEVLKGPQGTLFGESSLGGLIRYVTKDPKLDRVEGRVESTFFGTKDGDPSGQLVGVFNVPLVKDVLGLRIAGTYERNGGWIDQLTDFNGPIMRHDINDNSLTDVRAKLLYVPTDALRVSALVDVHRNNVGGLNIINVHPFEKSEFVQGSVRDDPTDAYDNFNIYNLTAQYNFSFATLFSSTSRFDSRIRAGHTEIQYSNLGAADQPQPLNPLFNLFDEYLVRPAPDGAFVRVVSEEVRLTSNGAGPTKWLIGGNWKKTRSWEGQGANYDYVFPSLSFELLRQGEHNSGWGTSEILAGFTDGSYTFFDRLEIGGGVRVYHEKQETRSYLNNVFTDGQSGTFSKTTYRIFTKYRLSDQVNLYANAATGFRAGVFNSPQSIAVGAPAATKPENSIFYEAGMKGEFFDKTLSLDLAVFRGHYRDFLQGAITPVSNGSAPQGYYDNSGTADIKGIEWQVGMSPVSGLKLGLGGDVLRSEFAKVNPVELGNAFIIGDPMDFVPKYDLTFTTDYAFDWGSSVPGFVNVSFSRKGSQQATNRNTFIGLYIDQTVPTNLLQASLGATVSGFELTLFARNILDERKSLNPSWSGTWNQERPRSVGVSVAKSFH